MSASAIFTPPDPTFPQNANKVNILYAGFNLNITVNNTPYDNILSGLIPSFDTKSHENWRITYLINCPTGLGNNEHLIMYGGMRRSDGFIHNSECFTAVAPFVSSTIGIGGGAYSSTATYVDSVKLIQPNNELFAPTLYLRVASGTHNINLRVAVFIEPYFFT